jgi:hypothetical protein
METIILKKRLSTFLTDQGRLKNVSDELLIELLRSWEKWTGQARDFYEGLGVSKQAMATLIGKAKRLSREGSGGEFKEINIESILGSSSGGVTAIELMWDNGKVIRFPHVDQLIDFLKKVA